MGVSASGYYAWLCRPPSKRSREEVRLKVAIGAAHERTRGTYGAERLQKELQAEGIQAGVGRIKRLRQQLGIRCKQRRKFKATTHSNHRLAVAENLLDQNFTATRPNQIWVADISVPQKAA
jgi:putative transposase